MSEYVDLIAEARGTEGLIVGELLEALEETLARAVELERLLSLSCNEMFDGVSMRMYQIELLRAWHLEQRGEGEKDE